MSIFPGQFRRVTHPLEVQLGAVVRDRISGFEGIAASRVEYLTGCTQIAIAKKGLSAEGKPIEWQYFDWQRLEVSRENEFFDIASSESTKAANGCGDLPPSRY